MNTTYQAILDLLIAYHNEWTLSRDEFDAVEHYQQAGYRLAESKIYGELESVILVPPQNTIASMTDERNPDALVTYYLVKEGA